MPVQELLARTSSRELTEWMAYARVEPFGEERADLRNGIIASLLANIHRPKGKRATRPEDFVMRFAADVKRPSPLDLLEKVRAINAQLGGKEEIKNKKWRLLS